MLLFGSTADLLGRKVQLLTGLFSISIFSLLTAFSPSAIPLLVLCGLLGLGTACISPPAIGTLFATYPEGRRRNLVTGALGCGNPVGFILGSVSSGLATKYYGWRASFMVVAGFFFVMAVAAVWAVPSLGRKGNVKKAVRRFDYVGAGLTVLGMALLTAGLTYVLSFSLLLSFFPTNTQSPIPSPHPIFFLVLYLN
jgi:MFS family permease